ncbi:MAG: hypothetical protein LBG88_00940 [Christensenellaceae bacterium]|jgi:hypothetical protein|nr:hypothetical protein [Christensenellaceae bacterium]
MQTKQEVICHYIGEYMGGRVSQDSVAQFVSQKTGYARRYGEAFLMCAKKMVSGECITRNVGVRILEVIARFMIDNDHATKHNVIMALEKYVAYLPGNKINHQFKNPEAVNGVIQRLRGLDK